MPKNLSFSDKTLLDWVRPPPLWSKKSEYFLIRIFRIGRDPPFLTQSKKKTFFMPPLTLSPSSLALTIRVFTALQSEPRGFWPLTMNIIAMFKLILALWYTHQVYSGWLMWSRTCAVASSLSSPCLLTGAMTTVLAQLWRVSEAFYTTTWPGQCGGSGCEYGPAWRAGDLVGKEATFCIGAGSAALRTLVFCPRKSKECGKASLSKKLKKRKFGCKKENDIYQSPRTNKAARR